MVVHDTAILLFEHSLNMEGDGYLIIAERENVVNCCAVGCLVVVFKHIEVLLLFSKM